MLTTYTVTGMTCSNCEAHVTEEVSEIPGVTSVRVNHTENSMAVESDREIAFDAIVEAVAEAGDYKVTAA